MQGSLGVWYPHSGSEPNQHLNLKPIYEALGPSRLVGLSVLYFVPLVAWIRDLTLGL